MNPQKSWATAYPYPKRNRGRHAGGALLSCKKDALIGISEICGRMKMSRREVLACLKQLTAQGYVKSKKKHLRLPHRAGTDPGRGMPPPP